MKQEEGLPARPLHDPGQPTREEYEQHMLHHMPYRAWCTHCVRGRGRRVHRPKSGERGDVPTVAMDFCYLDARDNHEDDGESESKCTPILVLKCDTTKSISAHALPAKECNEHSVRVVVDAANGLGHHKFILKSDQEILDSYIHERATC